MNNKCLFCKLANNVYPTHKFWEDKNFVAILDINPNVKGATLVIPKKHISSDVFKAPNKVLHEGMDACTKAAKILEKHLKPDRVCLITEGLMIDHLHFKLYPVYNVKNMPEVSEKVFFKDFPGYLTTQLGPKWDDKMLAELACVLRGGK